MNGHSHNNVSKCQKKMKSTTTTSMMTMLLAILAIAVISSSSSTRQPIIIQFVEGSAVVYSPATTHRRRQQEDYRRNLGRTHQVALLDRQETQNDSMSFWNSRGRRRRLYQKDDFFLDGDYDDYDDEDEDDRDSDDRLPSDAWYSTTTAASTVSSKSGPPPEEFVQFRDLGPIGKTVAGVTEVVFVTAIEYLQGFMTGYIFGTLFGLPGFITRPTNPAVPLRQTPFWPELRQRFGRMSTRSTKWAKDWAQISAVFSGFSVLTKVLRNGQEDVWNEIFSSAAAGAFFARKEGPNAMVRGALVYGGLIYMISGGMMSGGKRGRGGRSGLPVDDYTESPLSFLKGRNDNEEEEEVTVPLLPFGQKQHNQGWLVGNTNKIMMCDMGYRQCMPLAFRHHHRQYQNLQQPIQPFLPTPINLLSATYG